MVEVGALSDGLWIRIDSKPVGKGRPRVWKGRMLTPQKTRNAEAHASSIFGVAWKGEPISKGTGVAVELLQIEPRPQRFKGPDYRHPCPLGGAHCDLDNVFKLIADSLQAAGVFVNDAQIVVIRAAKVWAASDEGPSVELRVRSVPRNDPGLVWKAPWA